VTSTGKFYSMQKTLAPVYATKRGDGYQATSQGVGADPSTVSLNSPDAVTTARRSIVMLAGNDRR
jgi:hypothetical protein